MKSQLRKRLESFAWRASMMMLAVFLDYLIAHIGLIEINPEYTVIIGLMLGELSKAIKSEIDTKKEIKEIESL